jgi:hypothetical protein
MQKTLTTIIHNVDDCDYDDVSGEPIETKRRYKALCYEDIRLRIVQNPTPGERDLLKSADKKPKPSVAPLFVFAELTAITARYTSFEKKSYLFSSYLPHCGYRTERRRDQG